MSSRWLLGLALGICACQTPAPAPQSAPDATAAEPASSEDALSEDAKDPFIGAVTREGILAGDEKWAWKFDHSEIEPELARALGKVQEGAKVTIYLGVWCGDSRREVVRFWKALDAAGSTPFEIELIGVGRDRETWAPAELNIIAVPTFVVSRDGKEVGRVIESAPTTIEGDLLGLLDGTKSGALSATR